MGLGNGELAFDGGYSRSIAHQLTSIVNSLALQHVTTDVFNIPSNLGNDSMCLLGAIMDVGNGSRPAYREWRWRYSRCTGCRC